MENCGDEDIRTRGTCGDCCTKSWDDEPKMIDRSASPPNLSGDILCVTYSPCCNVIPAILSFSGGRESKKKKLAGFRRHFHLHEEAAIEPTRGHIRQIYYWRGQSMDCGWSVDDNTFVVTVQLQLSQWSAKCILLYMYWTSPIDIRLRFSHVQLHSHLHSPDLKQTWKNISHDANQELFVVLYTATRCHTFHWPEKDSFSHQHGISKMSPKWRLFPIGDVGYVISKWHPVACTLLNVHTCYK